ncbi:ATP synthase F1 subunit gamma [Wansuia hejianensis]|uniref:ATP synthase gamma chain n=1 Tax=Wansuia hejianensis TaxID=2763667 RepID=A0A926F1A4_9FIRM|nr:ATP synthase F1 subunit gamma [Wansuia hejianensis]MBC8590080.1 ATP synthase F1 subunit gamma [Wansuia hejianensis]
MAESTRDIKRRMRGINNTKQITKAMELVSSAKMRKARISLEKTRPYYETVLSNIHDVISHVKAGHPLLESREVKKSLYIVVTADRGLAGGYNANINRLIHSKFKDKKDSISLITVGSKGRDFFKRRGYDIVGEFVGISEEPYFSDAKEIGELATELFIKKEVDEINIVFTKFVSTISYVPTTIRLLPTDEIMGDSSNQIIEFEPSPDKVLDYLIPKYMESSIYGALIEASCSEQAARRTAMQSATDNAEEMIEELNMSYNRARQTAITMELSEIVAGAEALK